VLLAGRIQLDVVLARLASLRPVFHSEADFQQAFAWEVRMQDPTVRVRLETRPAPGMRLDLLLTSEDGQERSAVELKYLTRLWTGEFTGERFELKDQGAQDIRAHDVVKDIVRVEKFVAAMPGSNGAVVCVGNDPSYWNAPTHGRPTNADAFRIHQGTVLHGTRAWGPLTGGGTSRGREEPLALAGTYRMAWSDYSTLPGPRGVFKTLVVEVPGR
jgi:hypothetical protein